VMATATEQQAFYQVQRGMTQAAEQWKGRVGSESALAVKVRAGSRGIAGDSRGFRHYGVQTRHPASPAIMRPYRG
jgi:hypothetical protein